MTQPRISQRVLDAIGAWPAGMALEAVAEVTRLERKRINNAIQKLRRRGLIEIAEPGAYRLTPAGAAWLGAGRAVAGGQGPRVRPCSGLRERAWWLMRELRQFTLGNLLDTLASGREGDAAGNLRSYVVALERAGVLRRLRRRAANETIWRLALDLGRLAPIWRRRSREVWDPNSNRPVSIETSPDEAEGAHG